MNQDTASSDLFPDLEENSPQSPPIVSDVKCNNSSVSTEGEAEVQTSAKQILLKYQCMPLYPTTEESREQLSSFMERYHTKMGKNWLSEYDGSGLCCNSIREHVIILHSLFFNFCAPPPSIESICSVVLLESRRVASLRGSGSNESLFLDTQLEYGMDLPKDPLVHTSAAHAQFVIALLKSPPKGCMLKLPLEFQLSFFRILIRLLSEEGDQDYDEECLFDWTFMQKDNPNKDTSTNEGGLERDNHCTKKDPVTDTELDSSYHVVQRGASYSSSNENNAADSKPASQKSTTFRRSNSAVDIVTQAWNYGSWKKKKSSPLYSTLRFCSNLAWRNNTVDMKNFSNASYRQRWDFVADNVKLDDDEEKELSSENVFESSRERIGSGTSEKLVGSLIKVYESLWDECSKRDEEINARGQYLLFGPVAHLLGLTIGASGSSVKDLRQLLVMAEGSDPTKKFTKQNSRRASLSSSFVEPSLQETLPFLARLHIIRLLRYAADYSSQSIGILDKVGPQSFFSFGDSAKGLCTTLANKPWPFRYDFCMACWFRAETFVRASYRSGSGNITQSTILFCAQTKDGAKIELSFESCSGGGDNLFVTAATLLVTVADAHEPNVNKTPRKIRLVGCVLSPKVWYHVAVRLTKSKSSPFTLNFNKTNELSIFLNGKLMLRTAMKLPRFPENYNSLSGALGLASFGKHIAPNGSKALPPIELTFFSNFDGQAGALYVFNELIPDETIQLLYRKTAGQSEHGSWFTFSDGWDASRSKLGHIAKSLSSASMLSELEDLVLPDYPILIGTVGRKRKVLIDVQEDNSSAPSLASKLFFVWDPDRMINETVVDLHSGVDTILDEDISTWSFESIKDTLLSLGGPKRLIPLFAILNALPIVEISEKDDIMFEKTGINSDWAHTFISSLVFLIASFAREHPMNARELYRCGAVHVIHKVLHDRKRRELESYRGAYYGMGASLAVAKQNVSALLDLWQSSRQVFGLEAIVFSHLLFNVTLLFGGVSTCSGVHLHTVLLPVLSEITRQNPDKVRDGVGTKLVIDCIREYSKVECDQEESVATEQKTAPFDRSTHSSCSTPDHLTVLERRIFVDFMLGMVAAMLFKSCPVNDLSPLVTFLTYSLDSMWQDDNEASKSPKNGLGEHQPRKKYLRERNECWYLSTVKTANVLFFLLQKSPPIPHLIESLTSLLESGGGVASWLLCSLVNQFDDTLRGIGIKCLTAYLHTTLDFTTVGPRDLSLNHQNGSTVKLSNAVKYGLGVISHSSNVLASLLSGRGNVKVIYKLLWHLSKCHRERLGVDTDSGLMYLLVEDCDSKSSLSLEDLVVTNKYFPGGFILDIDNLNASQSRPLSRQSIRNAYGVSAVMRLLRFMTNEQKERWLFDLLALVLASPNSVTVVLSCDDWQPTLFQLVAEVVDEISINPPEEGTSESSTGIVRKFDTSALKPSVRTRYDLSLKLYSTLLGHCIRKGDEKAYEAIETTASLQRVDVNGPEVFGIVLSHLFADLIEKGTVEHVEETYHKEAPTVKNRALKQSARLVTQAILTNGQGDLDMTAAVKQWRSLRHLTALAVAVVTDFGFGITELFDYQLQDAAAIDAITSGVYGIRLGDNLVSGLNAFEALASSQYSTKDHDDERSLQKRHRFVSVVLASQVLTLLDAFIFPDSLDSSTSATQLHGLALVRGSEPRLGQKQGPLLASLVRLSLVLLHFLEPCSVRFLQACSRLRCFLHWALEIIRESIALGGYSTPYHELTAPYDRVVLAVVLHCHRALSRCTTLLVELESSPWEKYFVDVESWQKSHRRLFRAIMELREIVLAAYRGRNEVLRSSFSPEAHDALSRGLEALESSASPTKPIEPAKSKEDQLRTFLTHDWVRGFHDVHVANSNDCVLVIPDAIGYSMGKEALQTLTSESMAIIKDYKHIMNAPWKAFCEHQRKWAETDAVREMEHTGDVLVKKLSNKDRTDASESNKLLMVGFSLASQRFSTLLQLAHNPWVKSANWEFPSYTDLLFRRIVLSRIMDFDDHRLASYELTLGKDREQLQEEDKLKREEEIKNALLQAGEAIVPYHQDADFEDDPEESFVGWGDNDENPESVEHATPADEGHALDPASVEDKSLTTDTREKSDLDWDQLDFDEAAAESDPYAWAKKFVWSEGETFIRTFESVLIVTLRTNTKGTLLMTSQNLYFHQTDVVVDVMSREKVEIPMQDRKWKLNRLTDVHGRRYMLKAQALELFFADMRGVFIAFDGSKERDLFFSKLRSCKAPLLRPLNSLNPRTIFKKSKITELWKKRKLSNFQYLMALNLMAGRTFNDITQYPVFPWILSDYESEELDLSDHRIYRDLSKPVGALNPDRLACLIERFNELDGFPEEEKFLYGSHYSSPGVVLHYLVRQEPFTSMHIALQSGRFDCPDRLFFDIGGCWRSCLSSTSDVKELLPEFFTCPEIFVNTNSFPLGETQNKIPVDNVILPPWAKGSAHEFVRIHRLALESEYVSNNLHHWVDLIFGYKQRGPAAAEAHNIFHYLSYEGAVDIDKITDDVQRSAIEGHIQNFGQTPCQLIVKDPHPARMHAEPVARGLFSEGSDAYEHLHCHTPTKQFGDQRYNEAHGAIVSLQLQGDSILAIHSDFTICSYKFYPCRGTIPFQFKQEKARKLECRSYSVAQSTLSNRIGDLSFAVAKGGSDKSNDHGSSITDVAFFLMSIGYHDHSVKVHFADSLHLQSTINGIHRGQISCMQVSTDGTVVVTGGEDCTCVVWVVDYEDFAISIADGVVQPGDQQSEDEFLCCCHVLLGHTSPITCIAISTKLDVVVSGSQDGTVCLHTIRSGRFIRSLHINAVSHKVENSCAGNGIPVVKLAIHSDGNFVAHLCDGSLHVITVNGIRLATINIGELLNSMIICYPSATLITGGEKGLARMWNLHDLEAKCTVDVSKYGQITSMCLIPSDSSRISQFLSIGSENGLLSVVYRAESA